MGAARQLLMPKLGLTMTEGTVAEWPLAEGACFTRGQTYLVVETDKVSTEVEAPEAGTLMRICVPQGATVPVGTVLAEWEPEISAGQERGEAAAPPAAAPARAWQPASAVDLATARRLTQSKSTIPHFYLSTEIEVSRVQAMRRDWNREHGARVTLTHVILAAVARALGRHPDMNRIWENDGYVKLEGADVGVAVQTEHGLFVPVLRGAHDKQIADIAREADALIERARSCALTARDVGGGAITVSNVGMHDVTAMASIIDPGQSAILGVGSERQLFRPGADGEPRLAREVCVVLSCDHRVIDGVRGLAFLNDVRAIVEAPEALFS